MDEIIRENLIKFTNSSQIIKVELLQHLWSNYGELSRVFLDNKTIILKHIKFPQKLEHTYGWDSIHAHQRKVNSYQVEVSWYKNHNPTHSDFYTPKYIFSFEEESSIYLALEDLTGLDYFPKTNPNLVDIKNCIKWLAKFHSFYLGKKFDDLWPVGTYWHLATRLDELKVLADNKLKENAKKIDITLNSAEHKTLVHGDAKLANFLFNKESIAAVDFQYIGQGVGIKDLAYFLSSVFDEKSLFKYEQECLNYYFKELNNKEVEKEWRYLYPVAWCDFYRFLLGWSPRHKKINSYMESMKEKALKCI